MHSHDKTSKMYNNPKGLTLIEVLLALAIFAIGFLAIGTLVIATTKNTTTGNMMTQASMLAREKIEFLKTLPLEEMGDECLDTLEPEIFEGVYKRRCTVAKNGTRATIKVTVTWVKRKKIRNVVLETTTRGKGS